MNKVLLIDDSDFVRILLSSHLENIYEGIEILQAKNGKIAIEKLKESSNFDLIICDYNMPITTGGEVFEWMIENNKMSPFLLCSVEAKEGLPEFQDTGNFTKPFYYLQKPFQFDEFKNAVEKCVQTRPLLPNHEGYRKIRIQYFYRYNKALADIFVQLSEDHFVKIIDADQKYTKKDITKYLQKGQQHLFLREKDYNTFSNQLGSTPYLTLEPKNMSEEELRETTLSTHELMQFMLSSVGLSPATLQYAGHSVDAVVETIGRSPSLGKLIKTSSKNNSYIYDHSYLVSLICISISRNLDWSTRHTDEKLVLATLFHDILVQDHKVAQVMETADREQINELNPGSVEKYKAQLAKCFSTVQEAIDHFPMDVEKIVKTHHQYVLQDTSHIAQVTPLVAIFLLAHQFVVELYKCDFDENKVPEVLESFRGRFPGGVFEQALEAFDKCFDSIN